MQSENVLKPVLILSEIFTMSPMIIQHKTTTTTFVNSRRNFFYYLRLGFLLTLVVFCVVYRQCKKSIYDSTGVITVSVQFAHYNCRIPTALFCVLVTNFHSKFVTDFFNSLVELDSDYKRVNHQIDLSNSRKFARIIVAATVGKIFVQHIPYFIEGFHWCLVDFLDYIIFNVPLILIHVLTTQWMVYLNILKSYFVHLNNLLKTLKYSQCWVVNDYMKLYSNSTTPKPKILPADIIKQTGLIYDRLSLQGDRINSAFAWQILLIVPALFILIIFSSFNVCQMIKNKVDFDTKTIINDVLYFVSFLELVMPCVFVKEEADKFVDVLHRVDVGFDEEIDELMNSITLQTYHQKIEFSAFGVFPLDGTLIYSIFGALTTYLVILLQFDV